MRVLCSADWHIKLKTKSVPDDWAKDRFRKLFDKIHELEKSVDLHVIAGDWFDKIPSLEELELYYEYVSGCKCKTFIIPGNHEALKKDTTFLSYLKNITNILNSKVKIIDHYFEYENIDFIPYNLLKSYTPQDIDFHGDILVTHVRGEIPPHVKPEVNLEIFKRWKIVLAGDLHSNDNSQLNILYPGSPITTSFHRTRTSNGVIILDTDSLDYKFIELGLPQLIRKTIKAGEPMEPTDYDHTIYEVEGNLEDLAKVEDKGLLDKKVTKNVVDTALILTNDMSIEQEVSDYLSCILQVSSENLPKILKEFHDYSAQINF